MQCARPDIAGFNELEAAVPCNLGLLLCSRPSQLGEVCSQVSLQTSHILAWVIEVLSKYYERKYRIIIHKHRRGLHLLYNVKLRRRIHSELVKYCIAQHLQPFVKAKTLSSEPCILETYIFITVYKHHPQSR